MKTKNNIPPALLSTPDQPHVWTVRVDLPRDNWAELKFSQKELAIAEYNKIKSLGIYGGQWIQTLTINEHTD